jgi:urease accessory protein
MKVKNICKFRLSTGIVDGYPRLIDQYFMVPFGLLRFDKRTHADPWLRYMIRSSSPGILDGDFYDWEISVAKDTILGLETQGYQRIYEMNEGGFAKQEVKVEVGEGGFLHYIPHPTVPHKNSNYEARNTINLKESSKLIWGEVITCGRKFHGEIFEYKRLMNHTKIFVDDQLIFNDKLLFEPSKIDVTSIGQLEGYTHQATLIYYHKGANLDDTFNYLTESVKDQEEVEYGMSTTLLDAVVIRVVGNSGEQLYKIIKKIEDKILAVTVS